VDVTATATAISGKMSYEAELEEIEGKLRKMRKEKKTVSETKRYADERLMKIVAKERKNLERCLEIRSKLVEREAAKKTAEKEKDELRAELEALKTEYDQLKQTVVALSKDENENKTLTPGQGSEMKELELLRRKNTELNESVEKLQGNLESVSRTQNKERIEKEEQIKKLKRSESCLEDRISATKRIAVETQLRQLNELQLPRQDTIKLKKVLTELQQQQPATLEHHQGKHATFALMTKT